MNKIVISLALLFFLYINLNAQDYSLNTKDWIKYDNKSFGIKFRFHPKWKTEISEKEIWLITGIRQISDILIVEKYTPGKKLDLALESLENAEYEKDTISFTSVYKIKSPSYKKLYFFEVEKDKLYFLIRMEDKVRSATKRKESNDEVLEELFTKFIDYVEFY